MQITNGGAGVHAREVAGVDKLRSLPASWYAFTNLDLALQGGKSREIDVIIVADDRIFVIDLKEWDGEIESSDGRWYHNGQDRGRSPVSKIHDNAKQISYLLTANIRRHAKGTKIDAPKVEGLVVIVGNASLDKIAPTEISSVCSIDEFLKLAASAASRARRFGAVFATFATQPLTTGDWRHRLGRFFNVQTGVFKPGRRRYGGYKAASDDATFAHPNAVFSEYDAVEENESQFLGLLRVWDFTKCADTRFQSEAGRNEIAGREHEVVAYLNDRNPECETAIFQPRAQDPERGVAYWEIFERRRRLKRLTDFVGTETQRLSADGKLELARQILARAKTLHDIDAAHLDYGPHSIWLEAPSIVRFSHLMAARFPKLKSLGENRYQFLSSIKAPEDILGIAAAAKCKDVFLLANAIHLLLFGRPPHCRIQGEPPEWSTTVDVDGQYSELYNWFDRALSWDASTRFADASAALEAFNDALSRKPSPKDVIEGLERFGSTIKSQLQLISTFPVQQTLRDEKYLAMWRTVRDGKPLLIKVWKRAAWDDQAREGPRILDFLERARSLILSPPAGCVTIREAHWLGDAIVLVQDWIDAPDLSESLSREPEVWRDTPRTLSFIQRLTKRVAALHATALAHGDMKPSNVLVVDNEDPTPILIDHLEFAPISDGEVISTAYAPPTGGRLERDRFAVTKIVEECLKLCSMPPNIASDLAASIAKCRVGPPENGTLLPLIEAIDRALHPAVPTSRQKILLGIRQAEIGPILADEGSFFLRRAPDRPSLFIRGACEEIEIRFDINSTPFAARRTPLDQKRIPLVSRYEFMSIAADIEVRRSDLNEFSGLAGLLADEEFRDRWAKAATVSHTAEEEERIESVEGSGDDTADALVEAASAEPAEMSSIDLPLLWRKLIDAEVDLTIEGVATGESSFRRDISRHVVPFELETGTFDFNRDDRVIVERYARRGRWQKIGDLDIARSKPSFVVVDAGRRLTNTPERLVDAEQRLRFQSHFQITSRVRREEATSRILARDSRTPNLIDIFDPRANALPHSSAVSVDVDQIRTRYGLNKTQADAFAHLIAVRPLGLLQGPPGTGKTKFIASIVHYALTNGLASNVLLASQSHEAVNNAAEAVLQLFGPSEGHVSMLRVGAEGSVSDRLVPYHTTRVERLYKDRLHASLKERLRIAGAALGLPGVLTDHLTFLEMSIRPVLETLTEVAAKEVADADSQRTFELCRTAERQLASISIDINISSETSFEDLWNQLLGIIATQHADVSADKIARFRSVIRLARDFVGSVSTRERSFEAFLAGTRQIVAGTCVGLGRSSLGLTATPFDLVVVDEAARCTASELSVPLQAAKWTLLVGDHAQLEPFHDGEVVEHVANQTGMPRREILRSEFERVFGTSYGRVAGRRIVTQYRMLPAIGRLVSASFYGGILEHGRTDPEVPPAVLPDELAMPLVWVATDSLGERAHQRCGPDSASLINAVEADLIVALLRQWDDHEPFRTWLLSQSKFAHPIGVISTYGAQRDLLRRKLLAANLSDVLRLAVKVDTVDSYQGKENPIVVLSLVRNNQDGPVEKGVATIRPGFMARANRINVAMSRAMDRLIIVGARQRWRGQGPMTRVVSAFDAEVGRGEALIRDAEAIQSEMDTGRSRKQRRQASPELSSEVGR